MSKLTYEIKKQIASLSSNSKGWTKELNIISWNEHDPKYDIRDWDNTHTKMGKGVTLSNDELKELYFSLKKIFEDTNSEVKEPSRKKYNVEDEINYFIQQAPSFIQEIKNIILYMNEKGYSEELQRSILVGSTPNHVEEALLNEMESIRMMFSNFYGRFLELLKEFNEDELELFLLLIMNQ